MVRLKGAVETPFKLDTPLVSARLPAPWKADFGVSEAQPVPSPPAIAPEPQLELTTFFPKTVNWVERLLQ